MDFHQLKSTIYELLQDKFDHFSIYIQTKDGEISINAHEPKRAASTIKLPILIEAFRQIETKSLQQDALVYIENGMKTGGSGIINYLTNSNVYSYKNLLELMIIVSDNTASNIILDKIGKYTVNELAREIGCSQTKLGRRFMELDSPVDNYTSAHDMVKFLKLLHVDSTILSDVSKREIKEILLHQQLKDKIPYYAEEDDNLLIYHKSGELIGAEHDVAIMTYHEQEVYVALLSEGWANNGIGRDYLAAIGKAVMEYIRS